MPSLTEMSMPTLVAIGRLLHSRKLNSILKKASTIDSGSFSSIIFGQEIYKYTDKLHEEHPEAEGLLSKNHKYDIKTSAFDRLAIIFYDNKPDDGNSYIQLLGLQNNKRVYKWVRRDYISQPSSFTKYKVFIPAANGSGALGEVLSTPLIGTPLIGTPLIGTPQTFLTIGSFDTENEASRVKICSLQVCPCAAGSIKGYSAQYF